MEMLIFALCLKLYVVVFRAIATLAWKGGIVAAYLQYLAVALVAVLFGLDAGAQVVAFIVVFCTTVLYHIVSRVRGLTPRVIDPVVPLLHRTGLFYAALAYFGECWALNVNGLADGGGIPACVLAPQNWPLAILPAAIIVVFTMRSVCKWRAGR